MNPAKKSEQHKRILWNLEMTYNGRFQVNIERKDNPQQVDDIERPEGAQELLWGDLT